MAKTYEIPSHSNDASVDISLETIAMGKQALVFVNSKRSAEAVAEKIAKKNGSKKPNALAQKILSVLSKPTRQCERLAYCVERGTAFHHAGLASKQRELVEQAFLLGDLKIIAATPTLAIGVNLPAFRTIIRDLQRYTGGGMQFIPVLEYHQMAGRSGRPDFNDDFGEAIIIAKTPKQAEQLTKTYLFGESEAIYSKVAAMPVLRMYCLSLVASHFVCTQQELEAFFAQTFFAHQYGDSQEIATKIRATVEQLREWEFIEAEQYDEFASADTLLDDGELRVTQLGKRVSELYLDPLSAHTLHIAIKRATSRPDFFSLVHLGCSLKEMRPLLRLKTQDYVEIEEFLEKKKLLVNEPSLYSPEFETYLQSVKTAQMLHAWATESSENELLEKYNVRPGELRAKLELIEWLLYSAQEMALILKKHFLIAPIQQTRTRLKYGVQEELLALLQLKNVGRIRARLLYNHGIKTLGDVKNAEVFVLQEILGNKLTVAVKKQVGIDIAPKAISPRKRKGQLRLDAKKFKT